MPSLVLIVHLAISIIVTACGISCYDCAVPQIYDPVCATDGVRTVTFGNKWEMKCEDGKSNTGVGGKI
jgi:hypothetical protein